MLTTPGSYDETINLWDLRYLPPCSLSSSSASSKRQRFQPLATAQVGGGVWRLRWHPSNPNLLMAAVMHGGVRTLLVHGGGAGPGTSEHGVQMQVVEEFRLHDSMAYGLDWVAPFDDGTRSPENVVASCSFYDCKLNLWSSGVPTQLC